MNRLPRAATLIIACVALLPLGAWADDKGSEKGWIAIFNGKDLDGWEAYGRAGKTDVSKNWVVVDGVIQGSGEVSHLFTPRGDYKNFRYRAEVKVADKGNSGMYFRTKKGPGFPDGYEAQVNSSHGDPVRTGSLYNRVLIKKQLVPPDTWFTQEIEAIGNHMTVRVNGDTLYEYVDKDNDFKEGYFAFQQHDPGSKVWIRKVEVIELPDSK